MKLFDCRLMDEINPCNITEELHFTWKLDGVKSQKSYKISILLDGNTVYEKNEVTENQYCYLKLDLKQTTKYEYMLEVESKELESDFYTGHFYTALVNGFNKKAKWISNGFHYVSPFDKIGSPALYFKKEFTLEEMNEKALINMTGLGTYVLYINGKRVKDRVLEPAFTEYDKLIYYSSYDVLDFLNVGSNVIEVVVGDGFYNQTTIDTWGFSNANWRDNCKLLFELDLDDEVIVSDDTWDFSYGEITSNAIRQGETHDFNKKKEYYKAVITTPGGGKLSPNYMPPIREKERYKPINIIKTDDSIIYDFGYNMAGYSVIHFHGKKDEVIKITYTDRITGGKADNKSNSMYIFNKEVEYQTDTCILSGEDDIYHPLFTYHGFRYVVVNDTDSIKNIEAIFVHTDLKRIGYFKSDNETLNSLYDMTIRSILSNYHSIPTDCPHREKNGWTGDAQLSLEPSIYNFDMHEAYKKYVIDIINTQRPCGQISCIAPTCGWGYNWGSGPAWDIALFRITKAIYHYYNDIEFLKFAYPYLKKYFEYISTYKKDELLAVGLGDWNYPQKIKFDVCPLELSTSCYYLMMAEDLKEYSNMFEKEMESYYSKAIKETKEAILNKYKDEKSLTGMAALSYFGILDKSREVVKYLKESDYSIHMGILGVKFVLDTLGKSGYITEGLKILLRKEYPSFRYWMDNGQTTLCEDFELTNSLNHHMFSPIIEFMIRYVMGIEIMSDGNISFVPKLDYSILKNANYRIETNRGLYEFEVTESKVSFSVPSNGKVIFENEEYSYGKYEMVNDND